MLDLVAVDRVYASEVVLAMSTAFDNVCRCVSSKISVDSEVRRQLALIILRHVDHGEHDSTRLSELAFKELERVAQSASGMARI